MIHEDESRLNKIAPRKQSNTKIMYHDYNKNLDASLYKDTFPNRETARRLSKDYSNRNENSKHKNILKGLNKQKEMKILTNEDSRIKSQLCSMLESVVASDEDNETLRDKLGISPYVVNMVVGRNSGLGIKPKRRDSDKKVISNRFHSPQGVDSFRRNSKRKTGTIKKHLDFPISYAPSNFLSIELMNIKHKELRSSKISSSKSLNSISNIESINLEDKEKIKHCNTNELVTTIVKTKRSGKTFSLANQESQIQGSAILFKEHVDIIGSNQQTSNIDSPKNPTSRESSKKKVLPRFKFSKTVESPHKQPKQGLESEEIENIVWFENYNTKASIKKDSQQEFKIELINSSKDAFFKDSPKQSGKNINKAKTMKSRRNSKIEIDKDKGKNSKNTLPLPPKKKSSLKTVKINESAKNELEQLREEIRGNININNTKRITKSISKAAEDLNEYDSDEEDEKQKQLAKEENRKIVKKGLVYDSFSDEEEDGLNYEIFYIHPESQFRFSLDMLVALSAYYSMLVTPLILAFYSTQSLEFRYSHFCVEIFVDVVYSLDLISGFFNAYLDFEERLITSYKKMISNYAYGYMLLDFFSAMPCNTLISAYAENNSWGSDQLNSSFKYENSDWKLIRLLIAIRYLKLVKVSSQNKFIDYIYSNAFGEISLSGTVSRLLKFVTYFFIVTHLLACMWIYLGRVDYPNWIFNLDMQDFAEIEIYISGFYFILSTIFTIGYGDIVAKNSYERVFNILLLMVGILIYSYAVSSLSNIIQFIDEPTKRYMKRTEYLEELRIKYNLPSTVSEKIIRFLRYELNTNKGDKNNFLEELPKSLKNEMILRMYRPMIDSFMFFKNFDNVDFIIQVIMSLKPMSAIKNERLVKEGDFIEEIIFVKRGALVLEIGIKVVTESNDFTDILSYKYKFLDPLHNSGANNNLRNVLKQGINNFRRDRHSHGEAVQSLSHWDEEDEGGGLFDDAPALHYVETQYLKIIELRRNEHYGDVLMFLNRRSPLSVRVKTKTAELFLMKKTDVVSISVAFPEIFEEVTRKSAYNQKQLDWLIKKTKDIFFENHREEFLVSDNSAYHNSKNVSQIRSKMQNTNTNHNTHHTKNSQTRDSIHTLQKTSTPISLKETQINQGPIVFSHTKSLIEDPHFHSENSSETDSSGLTTQEGQKKFNQIVKNKSIITEYDEEDDGSPMNSSKDSQSYQGSLKKTNRFKNYLDSSNPCVNKRKSKISLMSNDSSKTIKESIRMKESFFKQIPTKRKESNETSFFRDSLPLSPKFKTIKQTMISSGNDFINEDERVPTRKMAFKQSNKYRHFSKGNVLLEDFINSEMEDEHIREVSNTHIDCIIPDMSKIKVPLTGSNILPIKKQNAQQKKIKTVDSSSDSSNKSKSSINKIEKNDINIKHPQSPTLVNSQSQSFKEGMGSNISYPIMYNFNINNNYNFDNRGASEKNNNFKLATKCPNCNTICIPISDNRQLIIDSNQNNLNLNNSNKNFNLSMNMNVGQHLTWSNIETSANSSFSILSSSSGDEKHDKKNNTSESPPHLRYLDFLSHTKFSRMDLNKETSLENTERDIIKKSESSSDLKMTGIKSNKSLMTQKTLKTIKTGNSNVKNTTDLDKNKSLTGNTNLEKMAPPLSGNNLILNDRRQSALQIFWHSKEAFINKNQKIASSNSTQLSQLNLPSAALNPHSMMTLTSLSPITSHKKPMNKLLQKKSKMTDGVMMEIHKNIEKSSLNLNDPQFFYSEFFHEVMNKKHDTRKKRRDVVDQENLNKRLDFIEKMLPNLK
jgi:hypothetical protein